MKEGWRKSTLGSAFVTATGSTPPKIDASLYGRFMPFVKPPELCDGMIDSAEDGISEAGSLVARTLPPKSILVSCIGTLGKVGLNKVPVAFNQQINAILPDQNRAIPEFIFYQVMSCGFKEQLEALSSGTTVPIVNKSKFNSIEIVLPPLSEQQRIVGILDEAFDGIATAKANTERNLQNARDLFESYRQAILTRNSKGWIETTLGAEIDLLAGFAFKSGSYTESEESIKLLRGDNIIQGSLRWVDVKKWPASDTATYNRYHLRDNDVVLAMDRPWVKAGLKHAMIANEDLPCLLVQRVARLRGKATLESRFLMHLVGSEKFTNHLLGVQTGLGVPHISGQQIKDFRFQRPPLSAQREIAEMLDELRTSVMNLQSIYQQKLAALDALKKSILHQAFTGQL